MEQGQKNASWIAQINLASTSFCFKKVFTDFSTPVVADAQVQVFKKCVNDYDTLVKYYINPNA